MSEAEAAGDAGEGSPPVPRGGHAGRRSRASRSERARRRRRPFAPLRSPVQTPRPSGLDRAHPLWLLGGALVLSALTHAVVVRGLVRLPSRRPAPRPATTTLRVAVVPKPPPPAPPAPEVPPAPPKVVPRKRVARAPEAPASPAPPPPPLEAPPPPPQPQAPGDNRPPVLIAGMSLSATSGTGTMRVGVGNGPAGSPREGTPGLGEGHPWKAKEFAAPYALTEEPVFLDNVPPDQIRRYYPEAARRDKIEAAVVVKMIVDDDGSVAKATIVKDPGNGFREAALKVARLYRFKPARVNGRAVATEIQFTIHFELE